MFFFQKGGLGVICAKGPGVSCASGKIGEVTKPGYERTASANRVLPEEMEKELADHIKGILHFQKNFWSFYHIIKLLLTPGTVFELLDSVFRYLIFILSDTPPSYTNPL